jgi:integrase/recombinase XerD
MEIITQDQTNNNIVCLPKAFIHRNSPIDSPSKKYLLSLDSKESRKTMGSYLNKVAAMFGVEDHVNFAWESITADLVFHIKNTLVDDGLASSTINTLLCAVRKTAEFAFVNKLMSHDEYERIRLVKNVKSIKVRRLKELKSKEIKGFLESCDDNTFKGLRDSCLFLLLVGCGLRRSEATSIQMKDINFADQSIIIHGKGNKERKIWFQAIIVDAINEYIDECRRELDEDDYLFVRFFKHDETRPKDFVSKKGARDKLSASSVNYILKKRGILSNLEFKPHDLRGTYTTKMLRDGEKIEKVSKSLGHSSIKTTQMYDLQEESEIKNSMINHRIY